jgi:signal peptidase II
VDTAKYRGQEEVMLYILIIIAIVVLDTIIKQYMERNSKIGGQQKILKDKIILTKYHNYGMFLNFMENKKEIVKNISAVFLGFLFLVFAFVLPRSGHRLFKLGLSMVLGGAANNVTDRMNRGYVVDYFSFNCKKLKNIIFNLSDIFIFMGSALIIVSSVFSSNSSRK